MIALLARRLRGALLGAGALLALGGGGVAAGEAPRPLLLPVAMGDGAPRWANVLQPHGWMMGDAVAVVAGPPQPALRAALLAAGAAVAELAEGKAEFVPGVAPLAAALEAVRTSLGARTVVVFGAGEAWGRAALEARHVGYAAAGSLGPGPVMRPGPPPPPWERWERRAPLLCDALREAGSVLGDACETGLLGAPPPSPVARAR